MASTTPRPKAGEPLKICVSTRQGSRSPAQLCDCANPFFITLLRGPALLRLLVPLLPHRLFLHPHHPHPPLFLLVNLSGLPHSSSPSEKYRAPLTNIPTRPFQLDVTHLPETFPSFSAVASQSLPTCASLTCRHHVLLRERTVACWPAPAPAEQLGPPENRYARSYRYVDNLGKPRGHAVPYVRHINPFSGASAPQPQDEYAFSYQFDGMFLSLLYPIPVFPSRSIFFWWYP